MFSKASKCNKVEKKQVIKDLKKIIHNMSNTSKVKTHSFRNFDFLPKYDVDSRLFNETVCSKIRKDSKFDMSTEMWRKRASMSIVSSTKPSIDEVKRSYAKNLSNHRPSDSFKFEQQLLQNQTFMSPQLEKRSLFSREVRDKNLFENSRTYHRNPSSLMTQKDMDWFKQDPNDMRSSSIGDSLSPN